MRSVASATRRLPRPRLPMGVSCLRLLSAAGSLLLLGSLSAARADTVTWTLGSDSYWDIASNWSSSPNLPGSTQDVQNNTTFTIEHRFGNDTINSFLSQGAFILSGGTLSVSTTFQVNNTFTLSGGTLANATVNVGTGGQGITVAGSGGTLSGVTLNTDATLNDSSNLTIQNGFHNASGINFNLGNNSTLNVYGTQTLDNLNVNFTSASSFGYLYANDTLTLGSGFKASGQYGYLYGNNIINNGTLSADVSGGYWYIQPTNFTNNGTVQAQDGAVVYLGSNQYLGSAGRYDTAGTGAVVLQGTLNNTGKTFDVASQVTGTGNFIVTGTIQNGTINNSDLLKFQNGTLDGVTLGSGLNLNQANVNNNVAIVNDFTNTSGININLGNSAEIAFHGSRTLDNLNVNFVGDSNYGYLYAYDTLTLGTGFNASGKYGYFEGNNIINNGLLSANVAGSYWTINPTTFTNNGTVQALDSGAVYLSGTQYLGSTGKYDTQGSGFIQLNGTLDNTGKTFDMASQVTGTQNFIVSGTILNGTVNNSDLLKFNGGTLDGVTLNGNLNLNQSVGNNQFTVQNAFAYPTGATFTLGNNAEIAFHGSRTLDNLNVNFVGDSSFGYLYAYDTLTLGSNFKAAGLNGYFSGNNIVNNGLLSASGSGGNWYISPTNFTNNGTVQAQDGTTVYLYNSQYLGSAGKYDTEGSGAVVLRGTLKNGGKTFDVASQVTGTQNFIVNGTIQNGTINNADLLKFNSGALDGVTLGSGLNLNQAGVNNNVAIVNDFAYPTSATFTLGNSAYLYVYGHRTLDNLNVNFVGDSNYGYVYAYNNLTLGSNFKANGLYGYFYGDTITNNGTLTEDVANGQWYVNPTNFTNNGTIQTTAAGSNFNINATSWTNNGLISAQDGTVYLGGYYTLGSASRFDTSGAGAIWLQGTLDNTDNTFDVAAQVTGTQNVVVNGTILNGTVNNPDLLKFQSGTLDGVTLTGNLNLNQAGVNNVVTVQNAFAYPTGATFTLGNNAEIAVHGHRTLDNLNVNFVGDSTYGYVYAYDFLTLGKNFKANGQYGSFSGYSITNKGTLTEDVANGQWQINPTNFTNNGTVQTTAANSTFNVGGANWTNNGLVSAQDGTVGLNGTLTLGSGSKFNTSGTGAVWLQGTLDNTGSAFDVASQVTGTGNFIVNGTILNGTLANAQSLKFYSGVLDGVNLTSDLNLNTAGLANQLTIQNDFTNASGINFNLGNNAYLYVHGDRALDNLNVNFVGDTSYSYLYAYDNLTLGSNFKATGLYGYFQGNNIINNGLLSANGAGGLWQIATNTFTNNGTVQAKDGTSVYLGGTQYLGSTGTYDTRGSGLIQLNGTLDNTGKTFDVVADVTGTHNFIVQGTILNGTVNNSNLLKFNSGTLDGVTLGSGLNLNQPGVNNNVTIQNDFAYPDGSTFTMGNSAGLTIHGDRTLDNLNVNFVGESTYSYLYAYDNLTLGSNFKASGKYGYFYGNNIVNDGTLSANVAGGNWYINPTTYTNNGTLEAKNGDNISVSVSSAPTSSGNIRIDAGSTVQFNTDLNQTGGTTAVDGDLYLGNGGGGSSLLNLSAGALLGRGTIHGNLANNGSVRPGSSDGRTPAPLNLTGNYTQTSIGILDIRLGSATDFGQLAVTGNASLNGTLDVSLSNGYHPAVGTEFDILTASNVTGTFATTGSLNTGFAYDVTYAPTFVRIKVTNNAVPGPDSLIVLGMGLMGVAARVRRRRK